MITRQLQRRDLHNISAMFADQYSRWNALDARLPNPEQAERGMYDLLDFEDDADDSRAFVAEDSAGLLGYMRASQRNYSTNDPQRMWLPGHHIFSEVLYQFAARSNEEEGEVFATLFRALQKRFPDQEPWAFTLNPAAATLAPVLLDLGFSKSSVFAYRDLDPAPADSAPPGVKIRPVEERDRTRLIDLFLALHLYHEQVDPWLDREVPNANEYLNGLIDQVLKYDWDWTLLVGEDGAGNIVGFSLGSLDTEETGPRLINRFPAGSAGFVLEFYVAPEARRLGLGRALYAATQHALVALAARQIRPHPILGTWLVYRATNPTSTRFWPALGFTPLYEMWRLGGWN